MSIHTNDRRAFQGSLALTGGSQRFDGSKWTLTEEYVGTPANVRYHRINYKTLFPNAIAIDTDESEEVWTLFVTYGSSDPGETLLNSTWTLDSNQHELRISNHPKALELVKAAPGWPRFIENALDNHYQAGGLKAFNYDLIKGSALKDSAGNDWPFTGYTAAQKAILDDYAVEYAKLWEKSVEAYLLPRWVIRNEIEVSAGFAFNTALVLYANVNKMLNPFQMSLEPLQSGEVIPGGMIVPGIPWWHKQPFQKTQTNKNTFIINREYWGLESFEPFLYERART